MTARRDVLVVTAWLLLGAALRLGGLGHMHNLLDFDEAYYGLDALSLLENPRLTPFFPANNGRESLWMYLTAPALALFEARPFSLRLVAAFTGILTLAAAYRLGCALLDRRAALWTVAALAVFYPHVHLSHLAFRALLYPLIGALALAWLLWARRHNRLHHWLLVGLFSGALAYTYFGARPWLALIALLVVWWFVRQPPLRRGAGLSLLVMGSVALPLALYTLANPDTALGRVGDQAALNAAALLENSRLWLGAWLAQGSTYEFHNPIGRPLLDLPLALLVAAGMVGVVQRRAWLIFALGLLALLPSLLSTDAPHFLRAVGVAVPVALVAGCGAALLWRNAALRMVVIVLLAWAGVNSFVTFQAWAQSYTFPGGAGLKLAHTSAVIQALESTPGLPVYYYQAAPDDPVFRFMLARFDALPLPLFSFPACTLAPADAFIAIAPLDYAPHPADPLAQWAALDLRLRDASAAAADFGYSVYHAQPAPGVTQTVFDGALWVDVLAAPDDALPLRFTALHALDRPYTLFLHLLDNAGGLVAQTDTPICADYPTPGWQAGQAVRQDFALPGEPGVYTLVLGIYDSETIERLPLDGGGDTLALGQITIGH